MEVLLIELKNGLEQMQMCSFVMVSVMLFVDRRRCA